MNAREKAGELFSKFHKSLSFLSALLLTTYRLLLSRLRLQLLLRRRHVIQLFSETCFTAKRKEQRVLFVISHIVQLEEAEDSEKGSQKISRLSQTLNGLLCCFSHQEIKIIINTLPDRNIIPFLPSFLQEKVTVQNAETQDPMMVGYYSQEIMIQHQDYFDWFVFLEDDIVIKDSYMLEKIAFFNAHFQVGDLLIPNRYEMCDGIKHYIDVTMDANKNPSLMWNRLSTVEIEDVKFSECQNPHGGIYCLSKQQLEKWIDSGRYWHNQMISTGILESAATFCLFETFHLYKPHSSNLHFLEVLHYDVKYSKIGHSQPQI